MIKVIFKDFPQTGLRLFFLLLLSLLLLLLLLLYKNISKLNTEDGDLSKEFNRTRITAYLIVSGTGIYMNSVLQLRTATWWQLRVCQSATKELPGASKGYTTSM